MFRLPLPALGGQSHLCNAADFEDKVLKGGGGRENLAFAHPTLEKSEFAAFWVALDPAGDAFIPPTLSKENGAQEVPPPLIKEQQSPPQPENAMVGIFKGWP